MARDDERAAALARLDELPDLVGDARIEARGRLVEEHDLGIAEERLRELHALRHAVREAPAPQVPPVVTVDLGEHLARLLLDAVGRDVLQPRHVDEETRRPCRRREERVLREDAEARAELVDLRRRVAEHLELAVGRAGGSRRSSRTSSSCRRRSVR